MTPYLDRDGLTLYHGEALEVLRTLPSASVSCIVSSPPYNVGAAYTDGITDRWDWEHYIRWAGLVAEQLQRVLVPGGRLWWNVQAAVPHVPAADGRRVPLGSIWLNQFLAAGLAYRDTIVWVQDSFDGACAWGSWLQPSAPNQRGGHELIFCCFRSPWTRKTPAEWRGWRAPRHELGGDWGNDLCRNVWQLRPVHKKQSQHPAAFPVELPARAIRLSTWPGEVVLDPFIGTGATALAARALGRRVIGIDLSVTYLDLTAERTLAYTNDVGQGAA